MGKYVKHIILTILLVPMVLVTVPELFKAIWHSFQYYYMYWWFWLGGGLYIVAYSTILKKNKSFLHTHSHEWLHAMASLMCFQEIESLRASSKEGGEVRHYGESNIFISLAPYTLPLITIVLLAIQILIPPRFSAFDIVVGYSFFFYLHSFGSDIRPYQTDLLNHGLVTSYLYIIAFASMNFAICLYAVDMSLFPAIGHYFQDIWSMIAGLFGIK